MRFDLAGQLAPLTAAYQRLSSRERSLLGGALAVIVVMGFYLLVWQPLEDSQIALAKRIQTKKGELDQMQRMRGEYLDLLGQFELRQKIIEKADPKFSLFPHIESTVAQVLGGRDKIASMNPQNKDLSGAYREESVELKLNGVSLQQLVDLMYHIEKGAQPLRLTRLSVKKRPRDPQSFDVTATVAMLKNTAGTHPPEHPPAEPVAADVPEGVAPEDGAEGAPAAVAPGEPAPANGAPAAEAAPAPEGAAPAVSAPPVEGAPPAPGGPPAEGAPPARAVAPAGRIPAPSGGAADRPPPAPPAGNGLRAPQAGAPPAGAPPDAPPAEEPPPRPHASLDVGGLGLRQTGNA